MGSLRQRLHHAFAVDPPGPAEPTAEQQPAVDWICRQLAKRRLALPGVIMLEMTRPLNYLASQTMQFAAPLVWTLARQQSYDNYQHVAAFLEQRGSLEYIGRRLEQFEAELKQAREQRGDGGIQVSVTSDEGKIEHDDDDEADRT